MREISSPSLASRTTLRLGGIALAELILETEEDLAFLSDRLRALGGEALVLGAGSNILAQDGELPLVLVRPAFVHGPEIVGRDENLILVKAGAGVPLPRLLRFCAANGLSGLEGLVGIPGSVGGAVAMNAGSFGTETCENIQFVRVAGGGGVRTVGREDLRYGYRSLEIFGEDRNFIVLEAIFGLTEGARGGIGKRMRFNFFEKKSRQPVKERSAGCVFRNPSPEAPAGWLLEQLGFKGKRCGGMFFSPLHANFLINGGNGTSSEALSLIDEARDAVSRQFGFLLEPEVRIVPCPLSV